MSASNKVNTSMPRSLQAIQSLFDGLINRIESVAYRLSGNLIKLLDVLAYILNLAAPLYIGAIWGGFLPDLEKSHRLTIFGEWKNHWTALLLLGLWVLALGWQWFSKKYSVNIGVRRKLVYRELKYVYQEAGLHQSPDADARCTIWLVPEGSISKDENSGEYQVPTRLVQWADYVPSQSRYQKDGRTHYRLNGGAGRLFRVYRGKADRVYVGILGDALNRGMEQKGSTSLKYVVPEQTPLVEYLVRNFNLRRRHARSVTPDRRAFLAIALIEEGSKKPLGVVYCDSKDAAFFTDQIEEQIFHCLPRLVDAISAKD